ncbi:long-chain-fatty-acid--CoA ligase [Mesorhizobium camelthorni]|uniref:3-methylmercaptopropionyl-CoA ligase n=2 Tax=Allomesorhizobium camelthorni TaxID=475069 RepID=A0A6G4WGY2_9HYPH|nr:long-chain-fatty-acid--CoA ligase [Mesorhizobium camelthorni]
MSAQTPASPPIIVRNETMVIGEILVRNARLYPDKIGYVFEGQRRTHRAHLARCSRLANALAQRGLARQARVAILAQNCIEYVETFGAGELSGFIIVNLNWRLAVPELRAILEDCRPEVLIFEAQFAEQVEAVSDLLVGQARRISIGPGADWAEKYEQVLAESSETLPAMRAKPNDTAYLIYTSGTTGKPKGVMVGHEGFLHGARAISLESNVYQTDRMLVVMPLFHIGGKSLMAGWTYRGATIYLERSFDVDAILDRISAERITCAHFAPAMIHSLLESPNLDHHDLSSLRYICYASAPMNVTLLRRAMRRFGPILAQIYGLTESINATILHPHQHILDGPDDQTRRLASAGQPFLGVEIKVVSDDGSDCPADEIGHILVRDGALMQGYWNNNVVTTEVINDGWFHTGDMGFFDREGFLFVADRKKDMIISGGENIYSREVEEALLTHPAVEHVAVIGVPDEQWGEAVKACVVLRKATCATEQELIEHCRKSIASYKKPRSVDFLGDLPRLFNGKIDKKALRTPYWRGQTRQVS